MPSRFAELREDVTDALEGVRAERRQLAYELVAESRTCSTRREARRAMRARLRDLRDDGKLRLDPATIFAIIQLAIAVWKLFREMGWLEESTAATVAEEVETLNDDD